MRPSSLPHIKKGNDQDVSCRYFILGTPRTWSKRKKVRISSNLVIVILEISPLQKSITRAVKVKSLSRVQLFVIPCIIAFQFPLSMELSRQEYWSRLPFASPGDLPNPGIEPCSSALQSDSSPSDPPGKPSPYNDTHQTSDVSVEARNYN